MKKLLILLSAVAILSAESLRIEIDEVLNNQERYTLIDVRSDEAYTKDHLLGALSFPILKTYENKKANGKLLNIDKMQKILRDLGLRSDSKIVVYDNGGYLNATRMFWALEVYGFKSVRLLALDYDKWKEKNRQFITTEIPKVTKSNYTITVDNKKLATKFSTLIATKNPNHIILDARDKENYLGKKSKAKRYGHIPTALSIPAPLNIKVENGVSKLKTTQELKALYDSLDSNAKVITYCTHGKKSAANYFVLRELGFDVASYDSSWQEWGNDFALPIVNLSKE